MRFQAGSGQLILAIVKRSVPGCTKGGRNYVYVKDVAVAMANALEVGRIGESYFLGHANSMHEEFFRLVSRVAGVKMPRIPFPSAIVKAIGSCGSLYGTLTGASPKVTLPTSRVMVESHFYSSAKAVNELRLPQTSIASAVREVVDWLRENRYLDAV